MAYAFEKDLIKWNSILNWVETNHSVNFNK